MQVLQVPLERLLYGDVQADIAQAYGANGLGILTVTRVPGYEQARQRLLRLVPQLAALPESVLRQYEDPESSYSVGWSHGREALTSGKKDTFKGSFYANPLVDVPCADPELIRQHPGYLRPNLWPTAHLPELEAAFKGLARIIIDTGMLLMQHCDRYVEALNPAAEHQRLRRVLESSNTHKARLLHYFPPDATAGKHSFQQDSNAASRANDLLADHQDQEWCGWHTDHGSLTGLTAAMYVCGGREVAAPDPSAGLYIRDRSGQVAKATIPEGDIAFQVGESLQIHSGGLLQATPHYVRSTSGADSAGVSRNTFAVFMQPALQEPLTAPPGTPEESVGVGQWKQGMDFGQFANATFKQYYQ